MRDWKITISLVNRAQRGDVRAYGELAEQFRPSVYSMALARLRNAADAQELTQDVFVHVFQKLRQLRQAGAFPQRMIQYS